MSAEAARELVAYAALLWTRGLVFGTSGNASVRLEGGRFFITPASRSLRVLSPDDLSLVDLEGTLLGGPRASSEWQLHAAAYRVRPDVRAVIHTHPSACVAWSKQGLFSLDNVGARESLGTITWLPYQPPGTRELADQCAHAFTGGFDTVVMADHGLSSVGTTLEAAFVRTDLAEDTARIALYAKLLHEG